MEKYKGLLDLLGEVIYLLPIAGLIWKAAMLSANVKELEKQQAQNKSDIAALAQKNDNMQSTIIDSINNATQAMSKLNVAVEKVSTRIDSMEKRLDRIEARLDSKTETQ